MKYLLPFVIFLSGCQAYIGTSFHPEKLDAPEYYAPNPIGIIGAEHRDGQIVFFVEHRSSIPYMEQGYGLNEAGVKYYFE